MTASTAFARNDDRIHAAPIASRPHIRMIGAMTPEHRRHPPRVPRAFRALAIAACLVSCACGARTQQENDDMQLDPATEAYQKYGYNDRPVDARLGPHRFRIPANYFRDQIGPDFQGNFSLLVQWPDLEPLPPGKRSGQDMDTFDRQITITPNYIDRVPIETLLEAYTVPIAPQDSPSLQDPSERLDRMLPQPDWNGLIPYLVDRSALDAYTESEATRLGMRMRPRTRESYRDWFVRRDDAGTLVTLIKCDHEPEPGDNRRPGCTHEITMLDLKIAVSMDYAREYLPAWQRIEDRARDLLLQYRAN